MPLFSGTAAPDRTAAPGGNSARPLAIGESQAAGAFKPGYFS
jgi:hypothetical protein